MGFLSSLFAAEESFGGAVGRHDDADQHHARQQQAREVVQDPARQAVAVMEGLRGGDRSDERAVQDDRQIQGRALEHRACILLEVVYAPLPCLLLRDESDGQGVERGQQVDLHETQEDHDGHDDGRALGDEERDDQQDQAWDLSERSGRLDGAPHAVAQARAGRRPGGGGRGVDAVHHGLSDLVDGLEHELAVLGGGEHEDEFEHRHGDEPHAELPVPVGPGGRSSHGE